LQGRIAKARSDVRGEGRDEFMERRKFMAKLGIGVIARYGNWYRGDDDLFTHCLILKNGECWLLGQGLQQVSVRVFKAHRLKFKKLKAALASIPAAWPNSSYGGYNFITNAESSNASEIAVYGKKPSGSLAGYFVPAAGSAVETLVKAIARIDA
jgi:hypothetical protein